MAAGGNSRAGLSLPGSFVHPHPLSISARLVVFVLGFFSCDGVGAESATRAWMDTSGEIFKGESVEALGPLALFPSTQGRLGNRR